MIVARSTTDKGEVLILGLSHINLERLKQNQPILIRAETHGEGIPKGWNIVVMYGATSDEASRLAGRGF